MQAESFFGENASDATGGATGAADFALAATVLILKQLDATFPLRPCAHFDFIPPMEISTANQDSFLPKIDVESPTEISVPEMENLFLAICAGKWTPAADGRPDWAFKALGGFCLAFGTGYPKLGYRWLQSDFSETAESFAEPLEQFGSEEDQFCQSDFVGFQKPTNPIQFWQTLTGGKLIPIDLPAPDTGNGFNPRHTARAYLMFWLLWEKVAQRKTVREIHEWLVHMKAIPKTPKMKKNKKGEFYRPYWHNTRTLLNRIGFPLTDKGGAPKTEVAKIDQMKNRV